jgi:hypothetical protein
MIGTEGFMALGAAGFGAVGAGAGFAAVGAGAGAGFAAVGAAAGFGAPGAGAGSAAVPMEGIMAQAIQKRRGRLENRALDDMRRASYIRPGFSRDRF